MAAVGSSLDAIGISNANSASHAGGIHRRDRERPPVRGGGSHQTPALVVVFLVVLVRSFTSAERAATFPTLREVAPVILFVSIAVVVSVLPERIQQHAFVWVLPPVGLLFLISCVVGEIQRFRRAPRFRSPKRD
jgi:hypothetical protein